MYLKYPFKYFQVEGVGKLFSPIITVGLETIFGWQDFEFLVDTGADISLIDINLCQKLKVKNHGNPKESLVFGIDQKPVKVVDLKTDIRLGNTVIHDISFVATQTRRTQPLLLGRKDIFEKRFNLLIDSQKQVTVITSNA